MWHQLWIPFLFPTLIIKSNCDDNNKTDTVFVRYGGHADAEYQDPTTTTIKTTERTTTTVKKTESTTEKFYEEATEDVVFVPNTPPPVIRDEEDYDGRGLKIKDIMMMKTVNDAMKKDFHVEKAVDAPNEDIVFISGKNHDVDKGSPEDNTRRRSNNNNNKHYDHNEEIEQEIIRKPKLNCNNLDCNNTLSSVCGAKLINNEWRYRLFLNECYFRKVNCGFKYEINRHKHNARKPDVVYTSYSFGEYKRDGYKVVELEKCKKIGAHYLERPFSFKPKPYKNKQEHIPKANGRRSSSSRRSRTMNFNGEFCSHPCPVSCSDEYDPECAISGTGQRRVFLNHCKLDLNSCFYGVVWHKRPLSECIGSQKADMRQNRGFIGWMQRVGIVDGRGRLVLE